MYPASGSSAGFHNASHHGDREALILDFEKINRYHVGLLPYFLEKLKNTPDGDSNLLENTLIIYGSPMGDPNVHNHKRVPLLLAGHMGGKLKGNLHLKAPDGTSMANVFLSLLHGLGLDDMRELRRQHRRVRSHDRAVDRRPRPIEAEELAMLHRAHEDALAATLIAALWVPATFSACGRRRAGCRRRQPRRSRRRARAAASRVPTSMPPRATG